MMACLRHKIQAFVAYNTCEAACLIDGLKWHAAAGSWIDDYILLTSWLASNLVIIRKSKFEFAQSFLSNNHEQHDHLSVILIPRLTNINSAVPTVSLVSEIILKTVFRTANTSQTTDLSARPHGICLNK